MDDSQELRPLDSYFFDIFEFHNDSDSLLKWKIAIKYLTLVNISGHLREITNSFFSIIDFYHFDNHESNIAAIQNHIKCVYENFLSTDENYNIVKDILYLYTQFYTDFFNEKIPYRREIYAYWVIDFVQYLSDYSFERSKLVLENTFSENQ